MSQNTEKSCFTGSFTLAACFIHSRLHSAEFTRSLSVVQVCAEHPTKPDDCNCPSVHYCVRGADTLDKFCIDTLPKKNSCFSPGLANFWHLHQKHNGNSRKHVDWSSGHRRLKCMGADSSSHVTCDDIALRDVQHWVITGKVPEHMLSPRSSVQSRKTLNCVHAPSAHA